ncbi:MAG: nitrilase-related carbon-nitrogen hydrolase [Bacteroidota bacterium]
MKTASVQFRPKLFKIEENLLRIGDYAQSTEADLVVFPELCTSGYYFKSRKEADKLAEHSSSDNFRYFQQLSTNLNRILVIGFPEKSGDNLYNSCGLFFPDMQYTRVYRKTHLFYREKFAFDPGNSGFFIVDYPDMDIRIGAMICYDWRFPEAARTLGLLGADLIVCPSNLVTDVWHISTPSRALENNVYLIVTNRVGTEKRDDDELVFNGKSSIYSYNGSVLAQASESSEEIIFAEIEPEKTRNKAFNEFNDIFGDRRPDFYIR